MPDLPPPPAAEVEIVVVHPPRLAPLGGEAAFSAVRISPETLKTEPRLDEALKAVPGVSLFRRNGSESANPTTQGLSLRAIAPSGAGRALVTLDGVPQNDPFGGWVIWSGLPSEGIGSATVIRGAGAGPFGAGALTGVVALEERPYSEGLLVAEGSVGERDSYRGAAVAGFGGVLATVAASKTDGYYAVRGPARGAADARLSLDDASVALRAQRNLGGVETALRVSAFQANQQAAVVGARSNATGASVALTLARPAADGVGGWRLQGWVRESKLENSSAAVAAGRTGTTPANDQYDTPATGYGLNAAFQGRNGALAWEVGADVRLADGETNERFRFMGGQFTRDRKAGGKTLVAGAYVEAAMDEGPWLATAGVRVDRSRAYDAVRREVDTTNGAVLLNQGAPNRADTTPTGRIGLRYELTDALYVRGAAYAGFRPPTLNELHRPFRVGNDITEANPGLKPETLQGVEAGVGGAAGFRWDATVFYNRLKDPITNVTIGQGPGVFPTAGFVPAGGTLRQRQNAGEIEAWGLEGEASGDVGAAVSWRAAFAYTDAEVDGGAANPQLTGLRPAQTPKWTVTGGVMLRPAAAFSLSADVRYESARWEDDLNTRKLGAGVQLDARAAWRFAANTEVYVAAENLTDEKLEIGETGDGVESYSAPQTFRVGVTWRR
jgi:outer membrane receptor protein involved in Fe transport